MKEKIYSFEIFCTLLLHWRIFFFLRAIYFSIHNDTAMCHTATLLSAEAIGELTTKNPQVNRCHTEMKIRLRPLIGVNKFSSLNSQY